MLRPHTPFTPSLDTGFTSRFALPGAVISDSGLNNPPLPPRSCYLSQYLRKGLSVSWEGNSKARLSWPVAPEYQYPSEASNQQPVQRRYRSELQETYVGNAPDQEYLVFDSGHSGGIKADGIAIFGNNFPQLLVELDTSSSFSSPYVFRIGVPVGDADLDYDCSLWSDTLATEGGNILGKSTDGRNLRFLSSTSQGWRPHQFASSESGQQFYVVASTSSSPSYCNVCRILDNTEDTLMLEEEADTSVLVDLDPLPSGFKVAIYSDRFAADFGAVRTYRYARISADITGPSASFVDSTALVVGDDWASLFTPISSVIWVLAALPFLVPHLRRAFRRLRRKAPAGQGT